MDDGEVENEERMNLEQAALCHRKAVQLGYASLYNPYTEFAAKEAARSTAAPRVCDEVKIKRILRYWLARPSAMYMYGWQEALQGLEGSATAIGQDVAEPEGARVEEQCCMEITWPTTGRGLNLEWCSQLHRLS